MRDPRDFDFSFFDCDCCGNLYAVSDKQDLAGQIAVVDIRQHVMSSKQGKVGDQLALQKATIKTVIQTTPKLSFSVKSVAVSRNCRYLGVSGSEASHDGSDYAVLAVVDLHGSKPVFKSSTPSGTKAGSGAQAGCGASGPMSNTTSLHFIDPHLFGSRPGLKIIQICWHPHSENHLSVLTSDNRWRLYSLYDPCQAEQTFHLEAAACGSGDMRSQSQFGLKSGSDAGNQITAFEYGPAVSWGMFTVNFISASGSVFALCPVAPFGMQCPTSLLKSIQSSADSEETDAALVPTEQWMETTFGPSILDNIDCKSRWAVRPHIHEAASPALQSLLDPSSESLKPTPSLSGGAPRAVAMYSAHHLEFAMQRSGDAAAPSPAPSRTPGPSATSSPPEVTCALVSSFSNGQLFVHLMQEMVAPQWVATSPQCITDAEGNIKSVRSECELLQLPPDAGSCCGRLMLMDAIELPLMSATAPDPNSDDDEDVGYGEGGGYRPGLERIKLIGSDESQQQLWACHASGCWNINITWLPLVAKTLAAARKAAATSGARMAALSSMLDSLPPPLVHEQLAVQLGEGTQQQQKPALSWAAALHDMFVGSVAVVCQGSSLHCMGARGQVAPVVAAAPAGVLFPDAAPSDKKPFDSLAGPSATSLKPTPTRSAAAAAAAAPSASEGRQHLVDTNIQGLYADLLQEPPPLELPKPSGPSGAKNAEGVAHLHDCINLIRQAHIERIHRAHHDLSERCKQLETEGSAHVDVLAELKDEAGKVAARQAKLMARLAAVTEVQRNLVDRADLLTSMHWSLPRPVSDAERDFSAQLKHISDRQATLVASWTGLQSRSKGVCDRWQAQDKQSRGGIGARPVTPSAGHSPMVCSIPPPQMAKVQASVKEQYRLISACMTDANRAEEEIKRWKRERLGEMDPSQAHSVN